MNKENQIKLYIPFYHGSAAILQPGIDLLKPSSKNANKTNAVFATSYFPKALACALLAKKDLQNKLIGKGKYSYIFDFRTRNLILHPGFNWDDDIPAFIYKVDKTNFFRQPYNNKIKNEYISFKPVKIETIDKIVTKEALEKNKFKIWTAKSVIVMEDLHTINDNSKYPIRKEILENLCQRII